MKFKLLFTFLAGFLIFISNLKSQVPNYSWTYSSAGLLTNEQVNGLDVDGDGNSYVFGSTLRNKK